MLWLTVAIYPQIQLCQQWINPWICRAMVWYFKVGLATTTKSSLGNDVGAFCSTKNMLVSDEYFMCRYLNMIVSIQNINVWRWHNYCVHATQLTPWKVLTLHENFKHFLFTFWSFHDKIFWNIKIWSILLWQTATQIYTNITKKRYLCNEHPATCHLTSVFVSR